MKKNKSGNQNANKQPQAQAQYQARQNTGKQAHSQDKIQQNKQQNNNGQNERREPRDMPGHGWDSFQSRRDDSFKKLPKTNCYRDWWVAVLSAIAIFIWAFWFVTKGEPEVREFVRLFFICTGGLLFWIFGQAFAAHLLRSFLLKLGFSKKTLDRKVYFGYGYGPNQINF
jgi:hypothetical protein